MFLFFHNSSVLLLLIVVDFQVLYKWFRPKSYYNQLNLKQDRSA